MHRRNQTPAQGPLIRFLGLEGKEVSAYFSAILSGRATTAEYNDSRYRLRLGSLPGPALCFMVSLSANDLTRGARYRALMLLWVDY